MPKSNLMVDDGKSYKAPDLFEAARLNDLHQMALALQAGQKVCDVRSGDGMTPVHVAAASGATSFLVRAIEIGPDTVWMRDKRKRRPLEHAIARQDREIASCLSDVMFPEGPKPLPPQ